MLSRYKIWKKIFFLFCFLFLQHDLIATPLEVWTNVTPSNSSPSARNAASMAYDPSSGRIILFGGSGSNGFLNDMWVLNYDSVNRTYSWTQIIPLEKVPDARAGASMAYDLSSKQMILFGGINNQGFLNDTWALTYNAGIYTWKQIDFSSGAIPLPRSDASMAYDPSSGQMILFGGSNIRDDTWALIYNAGNYTWKQLTTSKAPSTRSGASMVYDPSSAKMILFGGFGIENGGSLLNDTWALTYNTGTYTWAQLDLSENPPARSHASMAYDLISGQIILFGGEGNSGLLHDIWALTYNAGTYTWMQLNLSENPPARSYASMDYDVSSRQMILFGGGINTDIFLNDTWALSYNMPIQIILPATTTNFMVGQSSNFTLATLSSPISSISIAENLPAGITLVDNNNGTATLTGTPASCTDGTYPLTIIASNGFNTSVQNLTLVIIPQTVLPPKHLKGFQKHNISKGQLNFANILTWKAPSKQIPIVAYHIYRDSLNHLIGVVSSENDLHFKDRHLKQGKTYIYFVVSVDACGNTSKPAKVLIRSVLTKKKARECH